MLSGATQQALFKLCSLDAAVQESEAGALATQFLSPHLGQDYKHTGKPFLLAIFQIALDLLPEAAH